MRIHPSGPSQPEMRYGRLLKIQVDGKPVEAYEGETVAAAMLAAGIRIFRLSARNQEPRSLFCGMGVCYECLVKVDGVHAVRACVTPVAEGMQVETCRELEL
jgi:sarcosine oxidase subunit alpha